MNCDKLLHIYTSCIFDYIPTDVKILNQCHLVTMDEFILNFTFKSPGRATEKHVEQDVRELKIKQTCLSRSATECTLSLIVMPVIQLQWFIKTFN